MRASDWTLLAVLATSIGVVTPVLGGYLAKVYGGGRRTGATTAAPSDASPRRARPPR